ncbi:hypothetical protein CLOM_g252 [Closterium sp. NIES-68]|nr:hypothetical protein CLOM_g252 [Closterium sp. NIES-68]GJP59444.1 hypothetical protein CLOP_g12240 [Closterium sp. NIES-67]
MAAAVPSAVLSSISVATPSQLSQRSLSARRRSSPACQVCRLSQHRGSVANPKPLPSRGLNTFWGRTRGLRGSSAAFAGAGRSRDSASSGKGISKIDAGANTEEEDTFNEDDVNGDEEEIDEELLAAMLAEEELLAAELEKGGSGSGSGEVGGARAWSDEEWDEEELDELFDKYGKTLKEDTSSSSGSASNAGYKLVREEDYIEDEDDSGSDFNGIAAVSSAVAASRGEAAEAPSAPRFPPDSDEESEAFAVALAVAASDAKGGDIIALDVRPLVYWTQYFVIATAFSRAQMDAIAKRMRDVAESPRFAREQKGGDRGSGGSSRGGSAWTLLDYGDVVVHLFTPKERDYYRLEEFYANAEELPLPFPQQERYLM